MTIPAAQVFIWKPEINQSVWVEYQSRARTLKGLTAELRAGIKDGRFSGYRLIHVYWERLGNVAAPTQDDLTEPWWPIGLAFDFVAYLRRQIEWSLETFGPGYSTARIIKHIEKELDEVRREPESLEEWVDIMMLAADGAWRAGHAALEIGLQFNRKLKANKARAWPDWRTVPDDEPIEHERT